MPRKKTAPSPKSKPALDTWFENAGITQEEEITDTLEKNYLPYAMSVIISRALPEIDGFKPSHRKLLYTMYKMGLLNGMRTKSANVVGQTMRLNPHGDQAIYETMVRLTRANECFTLMSIPKEISESIIPEIWLLRLPVTQKSGLLPSVRLCSAKLTRKLSILSQTTTIPC